MPDLQALSALSSSGSSGAASQADAAADEDRLLDIADINARVLVEDDRLAAEGLGGLQGEPQTFIGIWPEASLLQHSCSPNTAVVVHKVGSCACVNRWAQLVYTTQGARGLLSMVCRQME